MFHVDIWIEKNILIKYEMEKYFCMILKIYKFIFRTGVLTFTNSKFFNWILKISIKLRTFLSLSDVVLIWCITMKDMSL